MEKTFTLTIQECLESRGPKGITPVRKFAPSLIILGLGLAAGASFLLWMGIDPQPARTTRIALILSLTIAVVGVLIWKWEARRSVRSQEAKLRFQYAEVPKETTFRLSGDSWTFETAEKSDSRKVIVLKELWETPSLFILLTDVAQLLPKRILNESEQNQVRAFFGRAASRQPSAGKTISRVDYALAWFESLYFSQRAGTVGLILVPLFVCFLLVVNERRDQQMGMPGAQIPVIVAVTIAIVWYVSPLVYAWVLSGKDSELLAIDDDGFEVRVRSWVARVPWRKLHIVHEGPASILLLTSPQRYFVLPKRLLSEDERTFIRSKCSSLRA